MFSEVISRLQDIIILGCLCHFIGLTRHNYFASGTEIVYYISRTWVGFGLPLAIYVTPESLNFSVSLISLPSVKWDINVNCFSLGSWENRA